MKQAKRKLLTTTRKTNADGTINYNRGSYQKPDKKGRYAPTMAGPHTLNQAVKQYRHCLRTADQWLVTVAQHLILHPRTDVELADILMHPSTGIQPPLSSGEAWIVARRLISISRDADVLLDLKYGTTEVAKKITLRKRNL